MSLPITQVDAFTDRPFTGNPAAVCILPAPGDAGWMQDVAREMNLSETAFLSPQRDGFDLRWFTPAVEVDLCGHATLASAHVLWGDGHLAPGTQARFHTRSGLLTADTRGAWIELGVSRTSMRAFSVFTSTGPTHDSTWIAPLLVVIFTSPRASLASTRPLAVFKSTVPPQPSTWIDQAPAWAGQPHGRPSWRFPRLPWRGPGAVDYLARFGAHGGALHGPCGCRQCH